jgi:hypothetical protein
MEEKMNLAMEETTRKVKEALKIARESNFVGHYDFAEGALFMANRGMIKEHCYHSWEKIACELSKILTSGQWWPGHNGVTYVNGCYVVWIQDYKMYNAIRSARRIVKKLTNLQNPPYSVTSCGRKCIKWTEVEQRIFTIDTSKMIWSLEDEKRLWHYRHCKPISKHPDLTLWDVSAFYYTILNFMPSPVVSILDGEITFHPLAFEKRKKWSRMIEEISEDKGLRNSMIGGMYAGGGNASYHNGIGTLWDKREGPIAGAAALVVRTGYELCSKVVKETNAYLACTDSAATTDRHNAPKAWTELGFKVHIKEDVKTGILAQGEADIRAVGNYCINGVMTEEYRKEHEKEKKGGNVLKFIVPEESPNPKDRYSEWVYRR